MSKDIIASPFQPSIDPRLKGLSKGSSVQPIGVPIQMFPCPHCHQMIPIKVEVENIGLKIIVPHAMLNRAAEMGGRK